TEHAAIGALGPDDEGRGVVEPVVEVLAARVREPEAEMEASVRERQLRDVEPQRALADAVEAKRACVLSGGREQEVRLVAQLVAQARRRDRRLCDDPEPHAERLARAELVTLVAVAAGQDDGCDPGFAAPPLAQADSA